MEKPPQIALGESLPPFRLFLANAAGGAGDHVRDFQSLEEVAGFKRRLDRRYVLLHDRKPIALPPYKPAQ
jgi:hypothetical protein